MDRIRSKDGYRTVTVYRLPPNTVILTHTVYRLSLPFFGRYETVSFLPLILIKFSSIETLLSTVLPSPAEFNCHQKAEVLFEFSEFFFESCKKM